MELKKTIYIYMTYIQFTKRLKEISHGKNEHTSYIGIYK